MKITVNRSLALNKYNYRIEENELCYAEANYTMGIGLQKILAYNKDGKLTYSLKQKNFILKIISLLLLPNNSCPKFNFYVDDIYRGKSFLAFFTSKKKLLLSDHIYEMDLCGANCIKVLKDNVEIGIIDKENITYGEKNRYIVTYDEQAENDILLVLLLIVFADIVYFDSNNKFALAKYEKTIKLGKN